MRQTYLKSSEDVSLGLFPSVKDDMAISPITMDTKETKLEMSKRPSKATCLGP